MPCKHSHIYPSNIPMYTLLNIHDIYKINGDVYKTDMYDIDEKKEN